ncbi:unnamed protein product, partial [Rotaria magnacalcarata]
EISRGRLIRTSDGILKEVELKHGGGSRFCPWNDEDDCKYKTQLYDFNQRVLDINAYENFAQYVERFGLNTNIDLLNSRGSTIFRQSILSAIVEIKCMQLNVNLHDEQSLNDVKRKIVSVENKISQILDEQSVNNFNIELNQQIDGSCRKALRTIEFLLVILNRYQMQAQQTNRNKYSRWSSPPRLFNET